MTSRILKTLAITAVASLVAGCKLALTVPSGGDVTSASGTRDCAGGSLCEYNITDATFNESFTAVARPGYVFSKWSAGTGFMCADSTNPTCVISNTGYAGGAVAIDAIIAGGTFFYVMPLFTFVGIDTDGDGIKDHLDDDDDNDGVLDSIDVCPLNSNPTCTSPITDVVIVNGKTWAQVNLFIGLSWGDINTVCPRGNCIDNGVLNGYDMTGWEWASKEDMKVLFNYFIQPVTKEGPSSGNPFLGPGVDKYIELASYWAPAPFAYGWIPTVEQSDYRRQLTGYTHDDSQYYSMICNSEEESREDRAYVGINSNDAITNCAGFPGPFGAWFFRTP